MSDRYINVNGETFRLVHRHPEQDWAWRYGGWIGDLSSIPGFLFEKAKEIDDLAGTLDGQAGSEFFSQFMTDAYAKELRSNWAIEGEDVDSFAIRSELVKRLGLNVPEWSAPRKGVRNDRENAVVEAALSLLNTGADFSEELIRSVHKTLGKSDGNRFNGVFGEYRTSPEIVGRANCRKREYEIIFQAPEAEDVSSLMTEYVSWWKSSQKELPTSLGSILAHLYFVEIHPFHDGNGRMSRLLMDKYLACTPEMSFRPYNMGAVVRTHSTDSDSTVVHVSNDTGASNPKILLADGTTLPDQGREPLLPYVCLSGRILSYPSRYYEHLDTYSSLHDAEPFVEYIQTLQVSALQGALRRAPLLHRLGDYFSANENVFSENEKIIIRNCFLFETSDFSKLEVTADIRDQKDADLSFDALTSSGIITGLGRVDFSQEKAQKFIVIKEWIDAIQKNTENIVNEYRNVINTFFDKKFNKVDCGIFYLTYDPEISEIQLKFSIDKIPNQSSNKKVLDSTFHSMTSNFNDMQFDKELAFKNLKSRIYNMNKKYLLNKAINSRKQNNIQISNYIKR